MQVTARTVAPPSAALAASSRRLMLEGLYAADRPLDVRELAAAAGLHVTTARSHLAVLEHAGLVRREPQREGRPGRPRQLFTATPRPEPLEAQRELLAALAGELADDPDIAQRAERAGQSWASQQVPLADAQPWAAAVSCVNDLFAQLGFAPQVVDSAGQRHLELHACPFRETARAHPQVVCAMHRGLLRGALRRLGLPATAQEAELRPFVEPELCIADVPVAPPAAPAPVDLSDRADVEVLIREFYGRSFADPLLGPVFETARMDLLAHLPVMCDFWETVLFRAGLYRRNALRVHLHVHALAPLSSEHFDRWLALWAHTVDDLFAGEKAELAKTEAGRIARSISGRLANGSGSELVSIGRRPGAGGATRPAPEGVVERSSE